MSQEQPMCGAVALPRQQRMHCSEVGLGDLSGQAEGLVVITVVGQ